MNRRVNGKEPKLDKPGDLPFAHNLTKLRVKAEEGVSSILSTRLIVSNYEKANINHCISVHGLDCQGTGLPQDRPFG